MSNYIKFETFIYNSKNIMNVPYTNKYYIILTNTNNLILYTNGFRKIIKSRIVDFKMNTIIPGIRYIDKYDNVYFESFNKGFMSGTIGTSKNYYN